MLLGIDGGAWGCTSECIWGALGPNGDAILEAFGERKVVHGGCNSGRSHIRLSLQLLTCGHFGGHQSVPPCDTVHAHTSLDLVYTFTIISQIKNHPGYKLEIHMAKTALHYSALGEKIFEVWP